MNPIGPNDVVEACLDNAIAYIEGDPENDDIAILGDEDGEPIELYDDDRAFAAYSYANEAGVEQVLYAECRVIVPGESTLEFNQFVALDSYDDEVGAREALLDGISVQD